MIKLVKVRQEFYDLCKKYSVHDELLFNENGRPCVLLLQLKYKGKRQDFVVPLRSNLSSSVPKSDCLVLPPNKNTRKHRRHGLHYVKLFPIDKKYIDAYSVQGDEYYSVILSVLAKKEATVINACQAYLCQYEQGNRLYLTPNIDGILSVLHMKE